MHGIILYKKKIITAQVKCVYGTIKDRDASISMRNKGRPKNESLFKKINTRECLLKQLLVEWQVMPSYSTVRD